MYLHKDREMFKDMVEQTAEQRGRTPIVVEKDYYVGSVYSGDKQQFCSGIGKENDD